MRRLTHLFVLTAFIFSCGGHWYVLQCVAWVNMVREYSQMVPVMEAVSMTFSGKYPCALCQAIAKKKAAESDKVLAFDKYEKKFFPPMAVSAVTPAMSPLSYPAYFKFLVTRAEPPPTPPPRPV